MRVLVYKRTHNGDPDRDGRFGCYNCMGTIRDHHFDAVIGVGGIGADARSHGLDGKVNWIGIGPHKTIEKDDFGDKTTIVTFDHFKHFGSKMPDFRRLAPSLSRWMYEGRVRHLMVDEHREEDFLEVMKILKRASEAPPSMTRTSRRRARKGCRPSSRQPPARCN